MRSKFDRRCYSRLQGRVGLGRLGRRNWISIQTAGRKERSLPVECTATRRCRSAVRTAAAKVFLWRENGSACERRPPPGLPEPRPGQPNTQALFRFVHIHRRRRFRRVRQLPESGPLRGASGLLAGHWGARNPATATTEPPTKWEAVACLAGKERRRVLVRRAADAAVPDRAPVNRRGTP